MGEYVRDLVLVHPYFETLFPRFPEPVMRDWKRRLEERGLPAAGKGNGGQGGPDRRGMEDSSSRRPASVKASLSVAFGQRAPNRKNVEKGEVRGNRAGGDGGRGARRDDYSRGGSDRDYSRGGDRDYPRGAGERDRRDDYSRGGSGRDRDGGRRGDDHG